MTRMTISKANKWHKYHTYTIVRDIYTLFERQDLSETVHT